MHHRTITVICILAFIALIAGCGGGGDGETAVGTTSLQGTVYAASVSTSQTDDAQTPPVPNCPVEAVRTQHQYRLGQTMTDEQGRYRFEGLTPGDSVEVRAQLRDGRRLMSRTRLHDGTCRADVDADTTMSAMCARLMDRAPSSDPAADIPVNETVQEVCARYHHQHRFQYGELSGTPPDFSDQQKIERAAEALLNKAADDAIQKGLQQRDRQSCDRAVDMYAAQMRRFEGIDMPWSRQARDAVSRALQRGWEGSPEEVADAAEGACGRQIAAENIRRARERIQQRHPEFKGQALNALEAAAIAVMENGPGDNGDTPGDGTGEEPGGPPGNDTGEGAPFENPEQFETYLDTLLAR